MSPIATSTNKNAVKRKTKNISKEKTKKKSRELKLKGWLATPQDWAEFDEWAKKNAKPKKLITPKPIVRCKTPLYCILDRLILLSKPKCNFGENLCVNRELCGNTLKAKASPRLKRLALPRCRTPLECREWGVRPKALLYNASETIINLSQPKKLRVPQDCKLANKATSDSRQYKTMERLESLAKPKRFKDDDKQYRNFVGPGEELPKLSAWMEFLALPSYKTLKDKETDAAIKMKRRILEEIEVRGKQALQEQIRKGKCIDSIENEENNKENEEIEETEEMKKKRRMEKEEWRFTDSLCKEFPPIISQSALKYEASELTIKLSQPRKKYNQTCRKDPLKVKESAKTAQCSERLQGLAKPKFLSSPVKRDPPREKDEFGKPKFKQPLNMRILPKAKKYIEAECKNGNDEDTTDNQNDETEGMEENDETESMEENDETERMDENNEKEEMNQEKKKIRPIDPIAYKPTIDPLFDPVMAKKQANERKRLALKKELARCDECKKINKVQESKENDECNKTSESDLYDECNEIYENYEYYENYENSDSDENN